MSDATKKEELLKQDHVRAMVAEHAYYISESEGFPSGREFEHWILAEEHVLKKLSKGNGKAVVQAPAKPAAKSAAKAVATKTPTKKAPVKKKA